MRKLHKVALMCLVLTSASGLALASEAPLDTGHIKAMEQSIVPAVVLAGFSHSPGSLPDRMAFYKTPGVSMAYLRDGRIAWTRTYGSSDAAGAPVTVDTRFQAASISKPITALAVLHLVQTGKLDLDVDVNHYLKAWKVPPADDGKVITLRELLTHTAGLTVHGFAGYAPGQPVPTLIEVLNGEKPANSPPVVRFEAPGTEWRYSGGGYVIIQQVLEDATGQPFPDLMQSLVLAPIGMAHSTYRQPLPEALKKGAATPFGPSGQPTPGGARTYPEMAPAGLWTTPSDLARYVIEIQNALAGKSSRVINQAMVRQYVKAGLGGWGLGVGVGGAPGKPWFSHSGANEGFRSNLVAYNSGDGFVVMTNSDNGGSLIQEVTRTIAEEYHWPDFGPRRPTPMASAPKAIDRYVGAYNMMPFMAMIVSRQGDTLVLAPQRGAPPERYLAESDRVWFSTQSDQKIAFEVDANGQVLDLAFGEPPQTQKMKRLPDGEVEKREIELAARIKAQAPDRRTEAAIRDLISNLREGHPNLDRFGETMGNAIRKQLPDLESDMRFLGELEALAFKGVDPFGFDIYEATYSNGKRVFHVVLDRQGRIDAIGIQGDERGSRQPGWGIQFPKA